MGHIDGNFVGVFPVGNKLEYTVVDGNLTDFGFPDFAQFPIVLHVFFINTADDENQCCGLHFSILRSAHIKRTSGKGAGVGIAGSVNEEFCSDTAEPLFHGNLSADDFVSLFFQTGQFAVRVKIYVVKIQQIKNFTDQS